VGDFTAVLRALILPLKDYGNRGKAKIREFLKNFRVQMSEQEFDEIVNMGFTSTTYQQTDDYSARDDGVFWHTHILFNPFYAAYFRRAHKDRLAVLKVLQNMIDLRFQFREEMLGLL